MKITNEIKRNIDRCLNDVRIRTRKRNLNKSKRYSKKDAENHPLLLSILVLLARRKPNKRYDKEYISDSLGIDYSKFEYIIQRNRNLIKENEVVIEQMKEPYDPYKSHMLIGRLKDDYDAVSITIEENNECDFEKIIRAIKYDYTLHYSDTKLTSEELYLLVDIANYKYSRYIENKKINQDRGMQIFISILTIIASLAATLITIKFT